MEYQSISIYYPTGPVLTYQVGVEKDGYILRTINAYDYTDVLAAYLTFDSVDRKTFLTRKIHGVPFEISTAVKATYETEPEKF